MSRTLHARRLAAILLALACETESPRAEAGSGVDTLAAPVRADSFPGVPDSAWIYVPGPTLIAFFPRASNDQLERDRDLAELLDHLSFNLGTATDSLEARGLRVTMRSGDTLWLRAGAKKWRFIRAADSSLVGFYVTSPDGRHTVRYGSGAEFSLLELADTFLRPAPTR